MKPYSKTGPFHRIRIVREQQNVTIRTVSRRSGVPMRDLREQEKPSTDVPMSVLLCWRDALDVPLSELLIEPDMRLSQSIAHRAKLVRMMKTILTLCEHGGDQRTQRLTTMLHEQMLELMPELTEVTGWPSFGSRRPQDELGRIGQQPISLDGLNSDALTD
ncbi:hypothetical protein Poly24_40360 [Rosistilla carotiformis]|uniref:HTH cro/C1-type domain-containing protein n=2 Tax=Rosistilla carotiformis TaxID=2528017 RepID=A0A518JXP9_9BACT|nr:hypothetical protein Poly24_40360 [Rosistilla carotiformis]